VSRHATGPSISSATVALFWPCVGGGALRDAHVQFRLVTSPSQRPIEYKGEPLDAERGPGLGCFRFQVVVLVVFIVLTPLTVAWNWPTWISVVLLFAVMVLLLVAGQTIIFLLRLVAADRRTRRRPLGSSTKTVGEIEDETTVTDRDEAAVTDREEVEEPPSGEGPVRQ
jgi:hypothetical protein